jgi:hypothetical protein
VEIVCDLVVKVASSTDSVVHFESARVHDPTTHDLTMRGQA